MQNHVQKIHEKKKFICSTCNAELSSKSILISHVIKKHKNKKILDNLSQLESNAKISLEDQEKSQSIKVSGDYWNFNCILPIFISYVTISPKELNFKFESLSPSHKIFNYNKFDLFGLFTLGENLWSKNSHT